MHVQKFEADTLDEALKNIKSELGPDAIILKTITNSGLKGAFKKKKIEVTAAISEKSLSHKGKIDKVLNQQQRKQFYESSSGHISKMIDQQKKSSTTNGYASMALNKAVVSQKDDANSLENFLKSSLDSPSQKTNHQVLNSTSYNKQIANSKSDHKVTSSESTRNTQNSSPVHGEASTNEFHLQQSPAAPAKNSYAVSEVSNEKIEELEKKVFELSKSLAELTSVEPVGLIQLKKSLKALDINDLFIKKLIQKAVFEMSDEELDDIDYVYEFALREMLSSIEVGLPLFASPNKEPVVTILASGSSAGQSTLAYKLAHLCQNSEIITMGDFEKNKITRDFLGIKVTVVSSLAELASTTRKMIEMGKNVFIDYKTNDKDKNETKNIIDGMRRSFKNVEFMITLSSLHSEAYNKKVISSLSSLADSLVVTHLDLCLEFGSLFNLFQSYPQFPVKFFSTGQVVPEDLEAASAERILGALFELD